MYGRDTEIGTVVRGSDATRGVTANDGLAHEGGSRSDVIYLMLWVGMVHMFLLLVQQILTNNFQ